MSAHLVRKGLFIWCYDISDMYLLSTAFMCVFEPSAFTLSVGLASESEYFPACVCLTSCLHLKVNRTNLSVRDIKGGVCVLLDGEGFSSSLNGGFLSMWVTVLSDGCSVSLMGERGRSCFPSVWFIVCLSSRFGCFSVSFLTSTSVFLSHCIHLALIYHIPWSKACRLVLLCVGHL